MAEIKINPLLNVQQKYSEDMLVNPYRHGGVESGGYPVENIVAYYKLEGNTLDAKGVNNGIANNVTYEAGSVGQRGVFNGTTANINCGNDVSLHLTSASIGCLVNTTGAGASDRGIIFKRYDYNIFLKDNIITTYSYANPTGYKSTGVNIADGLDHVIVLTETPGVVNGTKIYLDGTLILTTTTNKFQDTEVLVIGSVVSNGNYANAKIDEVFINNGVFTHEEVTAITNKLQSGQSLI